MLAVLPPAPPREEELMPLAAALPEEVLLEPTPESRVPPASEVMFKLWSSFDLRLLMILLSGDNFTPLPFGHLLSGS